VRFNLTSDKIPGLPPARLKTIAAAMEKHLPEKGLGEAFIASSSMTQMRTLNREWRGKDKATNVLSYPQFDPKDLKKALKNKSGIYLGDIALCLPYIHREAKELKKPVNHHLTHLVVHGVLHLLGYDHVDPRQAHRMEKLEKAILHTLGLPDPYLPAGKK
jgi:probable rRNA maturation factor